MATFIGMLMIIIIGAGLVWGILNLDRLLKIPENRVASDRVARDDTSPGAHDQGLGSH